MDGTALLEREAAVGALGTAVEAAARGTGTALFLRGDAGLGKSTLLRIARDLAEGRMPVAWAHGGSMEAELPFAYLGQLGPVAAPESVGPAERTRELAEHLSATWARTAPVLVLLDDLHWADPDSRAVLTFLARRVADRPVALVAGLRRWPPAASDDVDRLAGVPGITVVDLPELSAEATRDLAADLLGRDPSPEQAAWVWQVAGGNPVLVRHAVQALTTTEARVPPAGQGRDRARQHRALLLSHLAGLSADAVTCLRVCAVLGSRAQLAQVRAVTALDPGRFAAEFDSLEASGVVQVDEAHTVRFSHDLVAAAVDADTPPALRQELHRRAFEHHARGDDAAGATRHAVTAGLHGDARALRLAAEAASRSLRQGAVGSASGALDTARVLAGDEPPDWFLDREADLRFQLGQYSEAIDGYRRLLDRPLDPDRRRAAMAALARALTFDGRLDDGVRAYAALSDEPPTDPIEAITLAMEHAHAVWELTGPEAALAVLEGARDLEAMAPVLEPVAAFFQLQVGDTSGVPALTAAADAARARLDVEPLADQPTLSVVSMHVTALTLAHRFDEALEWIAWARERWWATGGVRSVVPLLIGRLGVWYEQGELARVLDEAEALAGEVELEGLDRALVDTFRAKALAAAGDREGTHRLVADTRSALAGLPWFLALHLDLADAIADLRGDPGRSSDAFGRIRAAVADHGLGHPAIVPWAGLAVEAHLAAGTLDEARAVVAWLDGHRPPDLAGWVDMVREGAQAGLAAAAGSEDEAEACFRRALAVDSANPLDRARIAYRFGCWLRRRRRPKDARPVLAEVVEVADRSGAVALRDLAVAELRAAGGRRRRGVAAEVTARGLTPQEHRIATLAATGATTREIADAVHVAPSTVETHLTRIYRKLGVASKRELRRLGPAALEVDAPEG